MDLNFKKNFAFAVKLLHSDFSPAGYVVNVYLHFRVRIWATVLEQKQPVDMIREFLNSAKKSLSLVNGREDQNHLMKWRECQMINAFSNSSENIQ